MTYQDVADELGFEDEKELFEHLAHETSYWMSEHDMEFSKAYEMVIFDLLS